MTVPSEHAAAAILAEAFERGTSLDGFPDAMAPADIRAGERIAAAVVDRLGTVACGIRLVLSTPGLADGIAGPVLEGRLLAPGTPVSLSAVPHAAATAAVVGVLAQDLPAPGDALPVFSALYPAIDVASSRFRDGPATPALQAADLAGLGQIVLGRPRRRPSPVPIELPCAVSVGFAPAPRRPRGLATDLQAALRQAMAAAWRVSDGLPSGALLVVAGLSPVLPPRPPETLAATFGGLGRAVAAFG